MARYKLPVESAAAVAAGTVFANVVPGASAGFLLRRLTVGTRTTSSANPVDMQLTLGVYRATARGTATTTTAMVAGRKNAPASAITGVDTAWSAAPTIPATADFEIPFNTRGNPEEWWDAQDDLYEFAAGVANGCALALIGNPAPASHLIVVTITTDE